MATSPSQDPTDEEVASAQAIFQLWQGGSQEPALDQLRVHADADRRWAVALMCWLSSQRGVPGLEAGLPYARKALELGVPWAAGNYLNNAVANLQSMPHLVDEVLEIVRDHGPFWIGLDLVAQGWNLIAQGHVQQGIRMMAVNATYPVLDSDWDSLAARARDRMNELDDLVASAHRAQEASAATTAEAGAAIEKEQADLRTAAKQAGLLVAAVVSDSTASLFKADAARNEKESKTAWTWGLVVLAAAAIVAVTPLGIHYLDKGPKYSGPALLGAHAGSTAALATVAGVLLARARSRDVARQRANDLSTAMGTMIAYSNQIQDPSEKQRFMMTMGQLVLQAHLTVGSGGHGSEDSMTGLVALANLVRSPAAPTSPPQ